MTAKNDAYLVEYYQAGTNAYNHNTRRKVLPIYHFEIQNSAAWTLESRQFDYQIIIEVHSAAQKLEKKLQ